MDQIKKLLATLSLKQRLTIVGAILAVAGAMYGLAHWQEEASFRPLYNSLSPEDASAVIQKLKEGATPYRLTNNGATILVPEDKVAELRLEMAGAGVPKNGRIGFEIFDRTSFGMTDFTEHVNYRRALEGELERSVMSVAEIEQARVHISLPQDSVFVENRQPAKASVLVKIRPGATLPETAMPAITNLVASAVEGLSADNVSVLDMRGNLLNRPKRIGTNQEDTSEGALEYRHKVEQDLEAKLDSTLEPLVGAGRFRTAVSAECDMTNGEQSEESFDPTKSVMVNSQKTEDISTNPHAAGGTPGTASNLPDGASRNTTSGTSTTSRKTESINYQTAHTVKRLVLPQGTVKRLSISVLLDQEVHFEGTGPSAKRILEPPSPERLKVIHDLAAAAVGFDTARGDQLIVESLPFESTLNLDPPPGPMKVDARKKTPVDQLKGSPKSIIGMAGILVAVLGGGLFLLYRKLRAPKGSQIDVTAQAALPESLHDEVRTRAAQDSFTPSLAGGAPVAELAPGKLEVLTNQLRGTAQKDAEVCAGVLRGWLREGA